MSPVVRQLLVAAPLLLVVSNVALDQVTAQESSDRLRAPAVPLAV